mmetsp:Transcript_19327/g.28571  ORF Transcript_19327/g.28571 Transcript_19327/m.28571 type:complete len:322 (+) Transcript_19327:26-991(+)|eukprot:CAMPEP_0171473466 /NCGR_PEP_ID=MMETSP0946-20130122/1855_1 /TAXON_ID=109269 /ORGANISM="Vaucheria litorea, Strain CCMP2940" /LENGTH=321 /DNA_ID=CAMNT_0012003229 /DNA_START=35 /DNA_END=1000 /DNA_ORIENTATION=-
MNSLGIPNLKGRSLLQINDLSQDELLGLIDKSIEIKRLFKSEDEATIKSQPLLGKSLAMIFQKRSTRTRVSTETGIGLLGGRALFLGPSDIQLGVNESLKDTAKVLGNYNSIILARVFSHEDVTTLKNEANVPVINALSDMHHPLQALADLTTLIENFGSKDLKGKAIAWVGDGNNVLHDLMLGCAMLGINLRISCPKKYLPNEDLINLASSIGSKQDSTVFLCDDPEICVEGCIAIFTDTWISMGQEAEAKERIVAFEGYQVTSSLMAKASPECIFMHCLPRHNEEVTDEVFYGDKSVVFQEAENRMWTVMAVMLSLLGK